MKKEETAAGPSQDEMSVESKIHEDIVRSKRDKRVELGQRLPNVDASKLLGRTFISEPDDKGEQLRAKIESIVPLGDHTADGKQELFRFRSRVGERVFERVMTYNKMLEWCDRDLDKDNYFHVEGIIGHKKDKSAGRGHLVLVQ